jgi:hypothetical protein
MSDRRRHASTRAITALIFALVATGVTARISSAQLPGPATRAVGNDSTPMQRYAAAQAELKTVRQLFADREQARRSLAGGSVMHEGIVALRYDSVALGVRDLVILGTAAREASALINHLYGDDAATTIGTIALSASPLPITGDTTRHGLWIRSEQSMSGVEDWRGISMLAAPDLTLYIANFAARIAESKVSPALRAWSPMPEESASTVAWRAAASALSTANSSVAQRCRAGSVASCTTVLEYDSTSTPLHTFFAPSDYPLLVARFSPSQRDSIRDPLARRCILSDDATACSEFVQRLTLTSPVPRSIRASVISLALETGGPHAFSRLQMAPGAVREQLAAAAGIPADSLTRLWLQRVNESSHPVDGVPLAALVWTAVFLLATSRRPTCI